MIIHIPNRNIITPQDPLDAMHGMEGWFRVEKGKVDANGVPIEASKQVVADWFPNIITDQGLNRAGTSNDWMNACQVGSGTAVPLATNTGLAAFIGGTTTVQANAVGAQASAPWFGWRRQTFRFAAGVATGNLSEVGVGWATTGATLFSRALILDGALQPTTITVLADEFLDVTYEFRLHPPVTDVVSNITITGVGTVQVTARAAVVNNSSVWAGNGAPGGVTARHSNAFGGWAQVFTGAIGAITTGPSGTSGSETTVNSTAYANNSLQSLATLNYGLNQGNIGGIRSVAVSYGDGGNSGVPGFGRMQFEFLPVINKNNTQVLNLNSRLSWGRRP